MIAFNIPLSSKLKSRSHCAAGNTYDIVVVSKIDDHPAGIEIRIRKKLYNPKPVAEIAVSKSAGSEIRLLRYYFLEFIYSPVISLVSP